MKEIQNSFVDGGGGYVRIIIDDDEHETTREILAKSPVARLFTYKPEHSWAFTDQLT